MSSIHYQINRVAARFFKPEPAYAYGHVCRGMVVSTGHLDIHPGPQFRHHITAVFVDNGDGKIVEPCLWTGKTGPHRNSARRVNDWKSLTEKGVEGADKAQFSAQVLSVVAK